ncbi:MAG TPA: ATP-binding protein [Bacillota bacterium]|nr:ATP-binding protein [Bacillota bacterium]
MARQGSGRVLATAQGDLQLTPERFSGCVLPLALPMPDEDERLRLWKEFSAAYSLTPEIGLDETAAKFVLSPGQIKTALAQAKSLSLVRGSDRIDEAALYESCYGQIRHGLKSGKARKVPSIFTWDDLILPPASKGMLRTACDQVRYQHTVYNQWGFGAKLPYGRGLSLLFSGPPGTGKTMGAQVVAGELKLELYKVDLAGVVSKYIGETEKNLEDIFREAAKSQAVLFFDEADVLFNKRTEVKDALDKYSNMEAAFMLQKIEEYEGVCVLATNLLQNFDEAFKRRLKFIVEFPFPNQEYRYKLWRSVFPARTPLSGELDYEYLARRFELSGSSIKNIAVNAAFMAAAGSGEVGMAEILQALRHELAKSGKSLSPEEFGEYHMLF